MKRIVTIILLATVICLLCTAGAPGTSSDPLVTRSYVDDVFVPNLVSEAERAASSALAAESERAERRADAIRDSAMMALGVPGFTLTESFIPVMLDPGDTVSMLTGGKFIPTSGTVIAAVKGTLINITTGSEVPSGSQLTLYNRYFCAEDTEVTYTARSSSSCLIDGYYATTGTQGGDNPAITFSDVPYGDWYYDAVYYCADMGLVEGMGGGIFSPATTMNMAQLTQLLYRIAGGNTSGSSPYWYTKAQNWAIGAGLITDDEFEPAAPVSREFFFRMFYACAAYTGRFDMTPRADITSAADYDDIEPENREAISWAVATGMVRGTTADSLTIDPDFNVNRATACVLIMRYFESA